VDPMLPDGKGSSSGSMVASKRGVEADIYSKIDGRVLLSRT
jgi:hypothetical protein